MRVEDLASEWSDQEKQDDSGFGDRVAAGVGESMGEWSPPAMSSGGGFGGLSSRARSWLIVWVMGCLTVSWVAHKAFFEGKAWIDRGGRPASTEVREDELEARTSRRSGEPVGEPVRLVPVTRESPP